MTQNNKKPSESSVNTQNNEKGKKRSESPVNEESNKKRKVGETQGTFIHFLFF